jgi:hypothetical protein
MKLSTITVGQTVKVRCGTFLRPATVMDVHNGRIGVKFTDVKREDARLIPSSHSVGLRSATVRPNAIVEVI